MQREGELPQDSFSCALPPHLNDFLGLGFCRSCLSAARLSNPEGHCDNPVIKSRFHFPYDFTTFSLIRNLGIKTAASSFSVVFRNFNFVRL